MLGEFGPADGLTSFTTSGQTIETGAVAEWILVPVTTGGYVASPDEIHLFTEECTPDPTTTVPEGSTLPFTGIPDDVIAGLVFAALTLGVLGWMLVMGGREDE